MIDLHCHVLPGIDDGPKHLEGSLDLARAAARDGVALAAATPHLRDDYPAVRPEELARRCEAVNEHIAAHSVPLEVVPGGELDLLWAHAASDEDLRLVSYGQRGTDLLLETPYGPLPDVFEDHVYSLAVKGFRILLAHPERSVTFQRDPGRLARLVRRGILLVQVTSTSLAAKQRRSQVRNLALALVAEDVAHVIASDAHSTVGSRLPELSAGVREAARVAPARARWMVTDAPAAILAGEPLPALPGAGVAAGRRWFGKRTPKAEA